MNWSIIILSFIFCFFLVLFIYTDAKNKLKKLKIGDLILYYDESTNCYIHATVLPNYEYFVANGGTRKITVWDIFRGDIIIETENK